ncbi:hypothetical protein AB0L25_28195 [Spirillospora sp. NPDC052242]
MFSERAFFSFVALNDPSRHREYNEWHQLDHRPENLALPGVAWGDRWSRTAECAAADEAVNGDFAEVDYVAMYWFRPPYEESIAEWNKLAEDSFQWGRGPLIPGVQRPLLAFFTPVKGYAHPRVRVSADVLPFRPNRGLHISLTELADPHSESAHEQFAWHDTMRIPDLLTCDGVAGAWTFSYFGPQEHGTLPFTPRTKRGAGSLRMRVLYLDEDPVEVAREIRERERQWDAAGRGAPAPDAERVLLSGPVRTIVPWQG